MHVSPNLCFSLSQKYLLALVLSQKYCKYVCTRRDSIMMFIYIVLTLMPFSVKLNNVVMFQTTNRIFRFYRQMVHFCNKKSIV